MPKNINLITIIITLKGTKKVKTKKKRQQSGLGNISYISFAALIRVVT